jgi:hypothetical protein
MKRKHFNSSIDDLESIFVQNSSDPSMLRELLDELGHRSTKKAQTLRNRVSERLAVLEATNNGVHGRAAVAKIKVEPNTTPPSASAKRDPRLVRDPPDHAEVIEKNRIKEPTYHVDSKATPGKVLSAWTALEVLSPQTFVRPDDLAGGDRSAVADIERFDVPWQRGERSKPKYRLYYQVILGSIQMEPAVTQLLERYGDTRFERPSARGNAVLAVAVVDRTGCLVKTPSVAVSSFAWGFTTAMNGRLADLSHWSVAESELTRKLEQALSINDVQSPDGDVQRRPLLKETILSAYELLIRELQLPSTMVDKPRFAIRSYVYMKGSSPPDPLLLNSFFLNDLAWGRELIASGTAPINLQQYLGMRVPSEQCDLLNNEAVLEEAVAPQKTPLGRWPSAREHRLVLLQQAAVNLALRNGKTGGILGVNGPPGTGKTTLLRDMVAATVTSRAEVLCKFDDPETAFTHSGLKVPAGSGWLHPYRVSLEIRGYEMVVASSNNKAVENVSAELPGLTSIGDDCDLRYFKTLSDQMHNRETWGLVAAVLGNAQNRARFRQTFWWDEDVGMSNYLAGCVGNEREIEIKDPSGKTLRRRPRLLSTENPPTSKPAALKRWSDARQRFRDALEKSRKWQAWLTSVRDDVVQLEATIAAESSAKASAEHVAASLNAIEEQMAQLRSSQQRARSALQEHESNWKAHLEKQPIWWKRLFRTKCARVWSTAAITVRNQLNEAQAQASELQRRSEQIEKQRAAAANERDRTTSAWQVLVRTRLETEKRIDDAREKHGVRVIDHGFCHLGHQERHLASPWIAAEAQKARENVFIAAMSLHQAFIHAAAKPLRHNLGLLMNVMGGYTMDTDAKRDLLPDLWSSLFLVVPLVSTTFASVDRMFRRLPPESLGWLFIDEAGQALPQAAVGALIRTKRALVVGDPAQLEPIVLLPDALVRAICTTSDIDSDRFVAPSASVQTLADSASPFGSEFQTTCGSRSVGLPLLVHRRCSDPMFAISNTIAYSGLMVSGKQPRASRVREVLGPSDWFFVRGEPQDKWCAEEGAVVVEMLTRLRNAKVEPDLYIVTPFVIVADRLRKAVRDSGVLTGWMDDNEQWRWTTERIGTVHTAQGREAEAVIFVLGAPSSSQSGARNWAGGRPNLLNVAASRAKEALYVVGNRDLWRIAGVFRELNARMPGDQTARNS